MLGRPSFLRKAGFIAVGLVFAAVGMQTLNPRELYREMYPLEPVKQDAFQICDQADPTFVRAVGSDREGCYDRMPHVMAVAMGRLKPADDLAWQRPADPSREVELAMLLAATPPRQPVTVPRSFSNTAWMQALARPCGERRAMPSAGSLTLAGLPPAPPDIRAVAGTSRLPVIALLPTGVPGASPARAGGDAAAAASPLPAPDIGDDAAPAIVPLAPATTACGGA